MLGGVLGCIVVGEGGVWLCGGVGVNDCWKFWMSCYFVYC